MSCSLSLTYTKFQKWKFLLKWKVAYVQIDFSYPSLFPDQFFLFYGNTIYVFDTYVKLFLWFYLEKDTSSIPGWYRICFTGRIVTTIYQFFTFPMMMPWGFWIVLYFHTHREMVLAVQQYFSHWTFPTEIGTRSRDLSCDNFYSYVIDMFGNSTITYEGRSQGVGDPKDEGEMTWQKNQQIHSWRPSQHSIFSVALHLRQWTFFLPLVRDTMS